MAKGKSNWTIHFHENGFFYFYNSVSQSSKWYWPKCKNKREKQVILEEKWHEKRAILTAFESFVRKWVKKVLLMEAKFNLEFSYLLKQKQYIHLPSSATYDSMLAAFTKRRNGEKLGRQSEQNFVARYRLVESNGVEKIYKGNQEVVKQEEDADAIDHTQDKHKSVALSVSLVYKTPNGPDTGQIYT
ncbi:hypothetical protein DdX_19908 [Ditylenchus destructor]|uniref:WW domain-containing protein n=1 Tax=Ditylenchus destructor TaxID=166010 RepID=A0AAD4MI76_9BILA|nr:hypothetical protein DdX_19908 [Ditylenchus destructor]